MQVFYPWHENVRELLTFSTGIAIATTAARFLTAGLDRVSEDGNTLRVGEGNAIAHPQLQGKRGCQPRRIALPGFYRQGIH